MLGYETRPRRIKIFRSPLAAMMLARSREIPQSFDLRALHVSLMKIYKILSAPTRPACECRVTLYVS
jgi:hypothetical protein